ncbi:MAG: Lrp/AsnC family transcriptional regulator [Candidatus Diapherotrites archaeon]
MFFLDFIDEEILSILRRDGRAPFLSIAKKLGVSEGTIRKRVGAMVKKKTIEKFTVETRTPFDFRMLICIRLQPKVAAIDVVKKLKALPFEVNHIYEITGDWDIVCTGETHDHDIMNKLLEKIRAMKEVKETKSHTVLVMR